MSKFDEILNSSYASDALLGEQIDKLNEAKVDKGFNSETTNFKATAAKTLEITPMTIVVPPSRACLFMINNGYNLSEAERTVVTLSNGSNAPSQSWNVIADGTGYISGMYYNQSSSVGKTLYIWSQHAKADSNPIDIVYKFI